MRWRVRLGYDGTGFQGWARQPGLRTVEGELLRGLVAAKVVPRTARHLEVASRTDRGVSARANALAIETSLDARALLRVVNGLAPDIYATAAAPMPEGLRIRAALDRTYRYFEDPTGRDFGDYRAAARLFEGQVDVRSFGREIARGSPVPREVHRLSVRDTARGWIVEVAAKSFVWGMVRKIVGACREVAEGRLTLARLERAIAGEERLTLPLAEPEPLVLWEVRYAEPWTIDWRGPTRRQAIGLASARSALRARSAVWDALSEPAAEGPRPG